VHEQFQNDLELEQEALVKLTSAIAFAIEIGDYGSKDLFRTDPYRRRTSCRLARSSMGIINEVGVANYLAQQINE